jgi:hypothetical protein
VRKAFLGLLFCLGVYCVFYPKLGQCQVPSYGNSTAAADFIYSAKNVFGFSVDWGSATTARYVMIFDGTALPSNGTVTQCNSSWVTGCLAWCGFAPLSTSAPDAYNYNFPVPLALKFGTVITMSTGSVCSTLTADGSNDFFYIQAY